LSVVDAHHVIKGWAREKLRSDPIFRVDVCPFYKTDGDSLRVEEIASSTAVPLAQPAHQFQVAQAKAQRFFSDPER